MTLKPPRIVMMIQVGSKLFPAYHVRNHADALYKLNNFLCIQATPVRNFDMTGAVYKYNQTNFRIGAAKCIENWFYQIERSHK